MLLWQRGGQFVTFAPRLPLLILQIAQFVKAFFDKNRKKFVFFHNYCEKYTMRSIKFAAYANGFISFSDEIALLTWRRKHLLAPKQVMLQALPSVKMQHHLQAPLSVPVPTPSVRYCLLFSLPDDTQ